MIDKPQKVKAPNIVSQNLTTFDGGLDERGEYAISHRSYSYGRNVMVDSLNNVTMRYALKRWLPDSVGFNGEISTVYYNDQTYYFIADDGRVKYIQSGDTEWTDCGTPDTPATLTTSLTGDNNDLVFTARQRGYNNNNLTRGVNGNNVKVAYVDPGENDAPLSVTVANSTEITVNLATDGGGAITTLAEDVMSAIRLHTAANKLVEVSNAGSDDGTGVVTAMSQTALAGGANGSNYVTTTPGVMTTFLRTNDVLLILNGVDNMRYIDLETMEMVQFIHVDDPTSTLTASATGFSVGSGGHNAYYAITYNGPGGETTVGPILSLKMTKSRSTWNPETPEYLTITFNDTPPAGAISRNIYGAVALKDTTPAASDLIFMAGNIPLETATFVDDGTVPFDIAVGVAPTENTTAGVRAAYGMSDVGTPILYGDPDNPYNMYFGAPVDTGVNFGKGAGGDRLELNKGTNYYPTSIIGFRNNQNIPSLLALFSNTEGQSKQQTITQKTITYGNVVINYWAAEDLNTGAAGVSAPYAVVNYLNQLLFPSSDGITSVKTEANLQNVLSPKTVSRQVERTFAGIREENYHKIVGCAWDSRIMFTVPSRGYKYNNQIVVYDVTNPDAPKWYVWDIRADWIGTISPQNESSFVYIRRDNHFFRLERSYVASDESSEGVDKPFPMTVEGSLYPSNEGRDSYLALNQAVFYIADFIGSITVGVNYVTQKGKTKTKSKTIVGSQYRKNSHAGWGSPSLLYNVGVSTYQRWGDMLPAGDVGGVTKTIRRIRLKLPNPLVNEVQFFVNTNLDNSSFILNSVSYQGVNIGVVGDIV